MEPSLNYPSLPPDSPGRRAGRPLEEWNAAYANVEGYFQALRVHNKMLRSQVVHQVLARAMERAPKEPDHSTQELAAEEMDRFVTGWYAHVLGEPAQTMEPRLSTKGRLALWLADMPGRWQDQFLQPDPWPPEFVQSMREAYVRAGPDFQLAQMAPRPLDLGPVATLTRFRRHPYGQVFTLLVWGAFVYFLVWFFLRTHL